MIMTEFPCPPLPVAGNRLEDSSHAVLNSHDMISVFMITALQMNNQQFNEVRRGRQEELELAYRAGLAKAASYEEMYSCMKTFTQGYIRSYMLHSNNVHVDVLDLEHAPPSLRHQIASFTNASAMLVGESDGVNLPKHTGDISNDNVRDLVKNCARHIVSYA
jgi:hypothetical protein